MKLGNLEITENPKRNIVISNITIDACIFKNIDFRCRILIYNWQKTHFGVILFKFVIF